MSAMSPAKGIKARAVSKGALIGVIAPGSPVKPERFADGLAELERQGYRARVPVDPCQYYGKSDHGFASASVSDRVRAIHELLDDDEVEAIIAARGAYGSPQLLESIEFEKFASTRKLLIGCSDVTALLAAVRKSSSLPSIHGPTLSGGFAEAKTTADAKESISQLLELISNPDFRPEYQLEILRDGRAEGPVIAGNLTMLVTLLGTPWDISYRGAILAIEEVGEAPYRVHRSLTQLKLAGKLRQLAGIVFGRFSKCEAPHGLTVEEVLRGSLADILDDTDCPVYSGLEFGHNGKNIPLAFGCRAQLEAGKLVFREAPIDNN